MHMLAQLAENSLYPAMDSSVLAALITVLGALASIWLRDYLERRREQAKNGKTNPRSQRSSKRHTNAVKAESAGDTDDELLA